MSGYTVEEPNEVPIHYDINNNEIEKYWTLYSNIQRKRFFKVLRQFNDTWFDVFNHLTFIRNNANISIEDSNIIMSKIHNLFIIEHRNKTEYYKDEKMRLRKQKGYIQKKINKLKSTKQKI